MACMVDFAVLFLESAYFSCTCIVLLFTPPCTCSGPRSDLLHMLCYLSSFTPQYTSSGPSADLQNQSWISFGSLANLTAC